MRASEFLTEGLNHPVIVVDVQPAYCIADTKDICYNVVNFVQKQTGPVLMFVNAERDGLTDDTVQAVKAWWEEAADGGYDEETDEYNSNINWSRFEVVDKGYGHIRNWMDNGVPPAAIIKTIRLMYQQRVNDSRRLFWGEGNDAYEGKMQEFLGADFQPWMLDDGIFTEWTSIAQLKKFSGAYLVGGGRNECLREVELLMNAFNIKYKRIDSLVY